VFGTRIRWAQIRWIVLAGAGAASIILGFAGWLDYLNADSVGDVADAGYRTLALLGFAGAPPPPLPWTLGLARFVVPIVVGWSAIAALMMVFRDRIQLLGLPFRHGHVVVVGLGDKGFAFVRSSRRRGRRVVVIERDPASTAIKAVRKLGAVVITGDGQDPEILISAGVDRAGAVFAVTDEDGVNAEVVLQSSALEAGTSNAPSRKLAHVADPGLTALLRLDQLRRSHDPGETRDYFSVDDHGARGIVARYAKANDGSWRSPLILVDFSTLNQRLLYEAARNWNLSTNERFPTIVIDDNADARWQSLAVAQPILQSAVEPQLMTKMSGLTTALAALGPSEEPLLVIDLMNDGATIKAAIALRVVAERSHASVVVVTRRSSGLRGVINTLHEGGLANIHAYALIDNCCTYELINLGVLEGVAQMAHDQYAYDRRRQGASDADPALLPWSQLSNGLRESNRDQARHIATKLRTIGCSIVPSADWNLPAFTFTGEEVERLAILEHERWCAERRRGGWRLGPRDHITKRTPYLVPWSELVGEVRELDRQAVRSIPLLLFKAGAAIERSDG